MHTESLADLQEQIKLEKPIPLSNLKQGVLKRKIKKDRKEKLRKYKTDNEKANWKEINQGIKELKQNLDNIASIGIYGLRVITKLHEDNLEVLPIFITNVNTLLTDVNHYNDKIIALESNVHYQDKEVDIEDIGKYLLIYEELHSIFTDINRVLLPTMFEINITITELKTKYTDFDKEINSTGN